MNQRSKASGEVDPFQQILEENGNNHHANVLSKFRTLKWHTLVSPYYSDNITDKSREIDIIVEKDYEIVERHGDYISPLRLRLFLECKYIPQETVLWFDQKDMNRTRNLLDRKFGAETEKHPYQTSTYHYGEDVPVAKLFGSRNKKQNEENEVFNRAISQCLNAFIYFKHQTTAPLPGRQGISKAISYPVIVCNKFEKLRMVNMGDSNQILQPIIEPFQLEVNYAYLDHEKKSHNEFFLIDVITIDQIDEYITRLEEKDVFEQKSKIRLQSHIDTSSTATDEFDPYYME